jgi:hypothetical protein
VPVRIQITTVGTQRVGRALSVITERAGNLEPVFKVIADAIRNTIADEVLSEGRGLWQPLSPEYARQKELKWGPQPILVASGQLLNSLTIQGAPGHIEFIGPDRVRVGSQIDYLRYHQSQTPRTVLPRRAPINISSEQRQRWVALIGDYISGSR